MWHNPITVSAFIVHFLLVRYFPSTHLHELTCTQTNWQGRWYYYYLLLGQGNWSMERLSDLDWRPTSKNASQRDPPPRFCYRITHGTEALTQHTHKASSRRPHTAVVPGRTVQGALGCKKTQTNTCPHRTFPCGEKVCECPLKIQGTCQGWSSNAPNTFNCCCTGQMSMGGAQPLSGVRLRPFRL